VGPPSGGALPAHLARRLEDAAAGFLARRAAPPAPAATVLMPPPAAAPAAPKIAPVVARPRRSLARWLLAAACFALAIGSSSVALRRPPPTTAARSGLEPPPPRPPRPSIAEEREALVAAGARVVPWTATRDAAATSASGDVVWDEATQRGYMRFRGLAKNDPTASQYQLWIFDADRDDRYPVDGGVFDVAGDDVIVPIRAKLPVAAATLFAVTVEKPGGVVVSSRERIVVTAATKGT
jgi:hypothetical protein